MKNIVFLTTFSISVFSFSQEHFAGLTNSSRVGIVTVGMNPAELSNLANKFEFNTFGTSINVSNNKIGFNDIIDGKNLENLIFTGTDPVNMRLDAEIYGPSVAFKLLKWGFALTTKANGKLNVVNVDVKLGDALINQVANGLLAGNDFIAISSKNNQRFVGTTWGEVGISAARSIVDSEKHKFSVGATFKLLFPGSYSNMGISAFEGEIYKDITTNKVSLRNATANLNFAYSGNLADSFTNFDDYTQSVFGGLNGFMGDIGVNYQLKDSGGVPLLKSTNKYKLNIGASIKNIGAMTFKDAKNENTNYALDVPSSGIDLEQFNNVDSFQDIVTKLNANGVLQSETKQDFTIKLPTTFVAYADIKVISKLFVSGYYQQKLSDDADNDQITGQNIITVTPRLNLGFFEAYIPLTESEISGFNAGFGLRLGGFYLGSGSIITSALDQKNGKQADIYTGFRWAFL